MTIPKIRQLPSGAWTCQLRVNGQSISITDFDRDKVEAQAYAYKAGIIKARRVPEDITVRTAIERYIEERKNILSPSTVRGYNTILRTRFLSLQKCRLSAINEKVMQRAINEESLVCSPKTLKNAYMFLSSALRSAGAEHMNVRLPVVPPVDKKYLTSEQIPILLKAIKGDKFEIPILLGLWSCRRSEIFGLDWKNVDFDKRTIKICAAAVFDKDNQIIKKPMPKTTASVRIIPICDQLYEALQNVPVEDREGAVVDCHPNNLYNAVNKICKQNGLPEIGAHGLRHSFASLAYHLNIPTKVAMRIGGWQNDGVMQKIYTHIAESDVASSSANLQAFFNNSANDNAND